jgi:hypothetical protein
LGIIAKDSDSPWSAATFIIPKKNGELRFVTDFRQLNQQLIWKPYPISNIGNLLAKLEGFTFVTVLDLNIGYYNIIFFPESGSLCAIVTPWGSTSMYACQWECHVHWIFSRTKLMIY